MGDEDIDCLVIDDDYPKLPLSRFCIPRVYEGCLSHVMIPEGMVKDRIKALAVKVVQTYETDADQPVKLLCVLKGAFRFMCELSTEIESIIRGTESKLELDFSFVRLQSYLDILVVEDLIDTGRSMKALLNTLAELSPRRVRVMSLFVKRVPTGIKHKPEFVGFSIPNEFIVGYAMDYNEHFRDLPHTCVISQFGREKYRLTPS